MATLPIYSIIFLIFNLFQKPNNFGRQTFLPYSYTNVIYAKNILQERKTCGDTDKSYIAMTSWTGLSQKCTNIL